MVQITLAIPFRSVVETKAGHHQVGLDPGPIDIQYSEALVQRVPRDSGIDAFEVPIRILFVEPVLRIGHKRLVAADSVTKGARIAQEEDPEFAVGLRVGQLVIFAEAEPVRDDSEKCTSRIRVHGGIGFGQSAIGGQSPEPIGVTDQQVAETIELQLFQFVGVL